MRDLSEQPNVLHHLVPDNRRQLFRPLAGLLTLMAALCLWVMPVGAASPAASTSSFAARVLNLTNAERAKAHLAPLVDNPALGAAAQNYAGVLSGDRCFAHTCPPQPDLFKRLESAGYGFSGSRSWSYGENIAAGYQTPEAVVAAWMASAGHRANILNPNYRDLGVGLVFRSGSRYGYYWVQDFGARNR